MKNEVIVTPNMFKLEKIPDSIEIFDVDYLFNVTALYWYNLDDVNCVSALVKKNIKDFNKDELELLNGNSWLILLTYGYDKLNNVNINIGYEKLSIPEYTLLTEHIRPDLNKIN